MLKVSVIVPVYNAARFVENAVKSAVFLNEVGEIILIEDGSPDNALEVCKQLEREYSKVKLFRHPNGENRGAAASRNLGILNSKFEYVSFLDADDWYLPNRFLAESKILTYYKEVDGVFGATGFYYQDKNSFSEELTTIKSEYLKNNLLYNLTTHKGAFHTNAITLHKRVFDQTGLFDDELKLHQDTHLWYRVAHFGTIIPGIIDRPIAYRRVHSENRIAHRSRSSSNLFAVKVYHSFKRYSKIEALPFFNILTQYVRAKYSNVVMKYLVTLALTIYHIRKFKFRTKSEYDKYGSQLLKYNETYSDPKVPV